MLIKGFIRDAELREDPDDPDRVEMILRVQGVSPGQPRLLVVPFEVLLAMPELEPEAAARRSFAAEVETDPDGRWVVSALTLAARILREE